MQRNGPPALDQSNNTLVGHVSVDAAAQVTVPSDTDRFVMDLEFVECLANPEYLHNLSIHNVLENPAFLNYLEYLRQLFEDPGYTQWVQWPQGLAMLHRLKDADFRKELREGSWYQYLHYQQVHDWRHPRTAMTSSAADEEKPSVATSNK